MAEERDYIELPLFDENKKSIMRRDFIVKSYIKGNPFLNRPYKTNIVSYCDAESSRSGTYDNDDGIVMNFVCDRCKKTFKADKAKAVKIYLNEAPYSERCCLLQWEYQRAFCGRCFKKTETLRRKIYEAICEFDESQRISETIVKEE